MQAGNERSETGDDSSAPSIWDAQLGDRAAPAVLQPEHFDDEPTEVVFLPCQPVTRGDSHAHVHLRYTDTDELALAVYSSLERLVEVYGEKQSWISVPADTVDDLAGRTGAEVIAYNATFDEGDTPQ